MFAAWGGDVIGMTGLPEAVFAREAGLCYAAVAIVTNPGAGLSAEPVDHEEVLRQMAASVGRVRELLLEAARAEAITALPSCSCRSA
jgi:5'-methylthioadenosine phosphorylase